MIKKLVLALSIFSFGLTQCMAKPFLKCCCPFCASIIISGIFAKAQERVQDVTNEYIDEGLDRVFGKDDRKRKRRRNSYDEDGDPFHKD